jgi:hypothetical protein
MHITQSETMILQMTSKGGCTGVRKMNVLFKTIGKSRSLAFNYLEFVSLAGLPDFSCYNIPKW